MFGYCKIGYFELLASAYGHGCAGTWSGARSYLLRRPDCTASQYITAISRDVLGLIVLLRHRTKGMLLVTRHHWDVPGCLRINCTVKT